MFDKFGEFDSHTELNEAAAGQKEQGDYEALFELAAENGIDKEDAQDYIDGIADEFATPLMAAEGKLRIEAEALELETPLSGWKDSIVEICTEDMELCLAVRKKGKSLRQCMARLVEYGFKNKKRVSDEIVDLVRVQINGKTEPMRKPLYFGEPNKVELKRIVKEYYRK